MEGQQIKIKVDVSGDVSGQAEDGVEQVENVWVPRSEDLEEVLLALGESPARVDAGYGMLGVQMYPELDERLDRLMADLGRLRWGYRPGRVVQLALLGEFVL